MHQRVAPSSEYEYKITLHLTFDLTLNDKDQRNIRTNSKMYKYAVSQAISKLNGFSTLL